MSALKTRTSFYRQSSFFETDVNLGVSRDVEGTRVIGLTNDFLVGFHRGLTEECGKEAARVVLYTCGRLWGERHARRVRATLERHYGLTLEELPYALFEGSLDDAFRVHGWGRLAIGLEHDEIGVLVLQVEHAIMGGIERRAERPVDRLLAGVLAGFFGELSGQPLECLQTECVACGGETGRFVLAPAERLPHERWDEEIVSHDEAIRRLSEARS